MPAYYIVLILVLSLSLNSGGDEEYIYMNKVSVGEEKGKVCLSSRPTHVFFSRFPKLMTKESILVSTLEGNSSVKSSSASLAVALALSDWLTTKCKRRLWFDTLPKI